MITPRPFLLILLARRSRYSCTSKAFHFFFLLPCHAPTLLRYVMFNSSSPSSLPPSYQSPLRHLPLPSCRPLDNRTVVQPAQYRMPSRSIWRTFPVSVTGSARLYGIRKGTLDRHFACNLGIKEAYLELRGTWGSRGGVYNFFFFRCYVL